MHAGSTIAGRFTIEEEAGRGGMGVVYRARDLLRNGATVALKVMGGRGEVDIARFEREAITLAKLAHPNIVRYIDHGETPDGRLYLAMEWLDGQTLAARSEEPLTPREAVLAIRSAASGLGAAHAAGIVHRDVKPANLFVLGNALDRIKVLDFGIARPLGRGATLTATGMVIGTAFYMAPEQARADHVVDARADVYSLGAVLYELLCGRPPFASDNLMAVLASILLDEPLDVRERAPETPDALASIVMRLLSKSPDARPADGNELNAILSELGHVEGGARASRPALTEREQRVLCLVLGAGRAETQAADVTIPGGGGDGLERMRAVVEAQGGRLEALADGSFVVRIEPRGTPTEQAVRAVRCAQAMRTIAPDVPLAAIAGRGMWAGQVPVGEVIERGSALLASTQVHGLMSPRSRGAPLPIRLDDVIGNLLEGRYALERDALGAILGPEHRAPTTLLGHTTPYVGRTRELGGLEALFAECLEEPVARAALITAPAGGGKSRLVAELLDRMKDAEIWIARGDPLGAGSPFALAAQLVRAAAAIQDGEPLPLRREKIVGRVQRVLRGDQAPAIAARLGAIARTPFDEPLASLPPDDPKLRGDAMRDAFLTWLDAELARGPIAIVIDDLQWGDRPTLALVDAALRELSDRPLFVLGAGRPEAADMFPELWDDHDAQLVRLARLTPKASEKIVRHALVHADDALVDRLVERADGNPFFLEELVRAVSEGRGEGALPPTVLGMIEARLAVLDAETRRVLRAASVFGRRFWREGIVELLGGVDRAGDVDAHLDVIVQRELADRTPEPRLSGQIELAFRHALTREAAFAMLTDEDRRLGHRLAGDWLERAGERDALVLAEHFERGGDGKRAAEWLGRAAERALEGDDLAGAIERAERGLSAADAETRAAILVTLADAHRWRGEYAEAFARATLAAEALEPGTRAWFRALGVLFAAAGRIGRADEAEALRARAVAIDAYPNAASAQVVVLCRAATLALAARDSARFEATMERAEQLARTRCPADPIARAWIQTLHASQALAGGDLGAFVDGTEAAIASYEAAGDARDACNQKVRLGNAYVGLGDPERAEVVLREALAAARRMGLSLIEGYALQNLGHALLARDRREAAIESEDAAIAIAQRLGDPVLEAGSLLYRAEANGSSADAARAVSLLGSVPPFLAVARAVLARTLLEADPEAALREATLAYEAAKGLEEGETLVHLVYAEALRANGRAEEARAMARSAASRLEERAAKIADPEWREAFLRVPAHARMRALAE